jgi:hypothetical protein
LLPREQDVKQILVIPTEIPPNNTTTVPRLPALAPAGKPSMVASSK